MSKNNLGNNNTGRDNTGARNIGDRNTGDDNFGSDNTGSRNSGYRNPGDRNTGAFNSGNRNSGDRNTGDNNSGNNNTGDFNSGDWNPGYFNTDEPTVRMFNRDTGLTRDQINLPLIYLQLTKRIPVEKMTADQKNQHPEYKITNGILVEQSYHQAWEEEWSIMNKEDKQKIINLPNFDPEIFKEITGIDVREDCSIELSNKQEQQVKQQTEETTVTQINTVGEAIDFMMANPNKSLEDNEGARYFYDGLNLTKEVLGDEEDTSLADIKKALPLYPFEERVLITKKQAENLYWLGYRHSTMLTVGNMCPAPADTRQNQQRELKDELDELGFTVDSED